MQKNNFYMPRKFILSRLKPKSSLNSPNLGAHPAFYQKQGFEPVTLSRLFTQQWSFFFNLKSSFVNIFVVDTS